MAEATQVSAHVVVDKGNVVLMLKSAGISDLPFTLDPQLASELAENIARGAHEARFGHAPVSDVSYLHQQVKSRVIENMRQLLITRITVMLNSMREDKGWSNRRLAMELVDVIFAKVA